MATRNKVSHFLLAINILLLVEKCLTEVVITDTQYKVHIASFHSVAASFGHELPEKGLHGAALEASPKEACEPIENPPLHPKNMSWIAVIARYGGCTFEDKVRIAMEANFSAAIIYNVDSNKVIQMGGQDDSLIPSIFIGYQSGKDILKHFTYDHSHEVRMIITDDEPFDINAYLLPFAIVVGICFLIMLAIVIFKCIQDHRRRMRHRLPKSALKKLPIHKFKSGDPYETCCICLDDFTDGDKLRILPCDHAYHSKCIDSWLVKHKRICPQCRKRVFERGTGYNSSDSEENNERAPLLGASAGRPGPSGGGTFSSNAIGRPGPSSGILDRLQAAGSSTSAQSDNVLAVNESRRLLQHRRFRRPRRLRRVYEVLSESTTSSENEGEGALLDNTVEAPEQHLESQGAVGGPIVQSYTQVGVQEHSDNPVTSSTEVLVNVDSCKTEISAEITVHASETVVRTPNTEEQNESPPEVPIYAVRGNRTPDDSEDSDHEPSLFVVGSQRSHSQQFHRPENA